MKSMTETNVKDALAGESQAHIKYHNFAEKAEADGMANIARLFKAASYSEMVHASAHLKALGGVGTTAENLDGAFGGETFEIDEMYPAYIEVAKLQGEAAAEKSLVRAYETEKVHQGLYEKAKAAVASGKDAELPDIYVCPVCGFTMYDDVPDKCPLCGTSSIKYVKF